MNCRYNFVLRKDKENNDMNIIGHVYTDFQEKFGIPRQSGLVEELEGKILFEPEYGTKEAVKGLEEFSHIWLIWGFSENRRENYSLTVRPPKLGGNTRKGVFSTRSPFRPNGMGLSCVRLEKIEFDEKERPILYVKGADLMNGTPIFDIKPYIPYTDCHPDATGGFTEHIHTEKLDVIFPPELLAMIPEAKRPALIGILAEDPRPGYQHDPDRRYGVAFAGFDVRFHINGNVLTVCEVVAVQ